MAELRPGRVVTQKALWLSTFSFHPPPSGGKICDAAAAFRRGQHRLQKQDFAYFFQFKLDVKAFTAIFNHCMFWVIYVDSCSVEVVILDQDLDHLVVFCSTFDVNLKSSKLLT